jgi:hypothetical protein
VPKESSSSPKAWANDVVKGRRIVEEQANEPHEETSEIVEHSDGLMRTTMFR